MDPGTVSVGFDHCSLSCAVSLGHAEFRTVALVMPLENIGLNRGEVHENTVARIAPDYSLACFDVESHPPRLVLSLSPLVRFEAPDSTPGRPEAFVCSFIAPTGPDTSGPQGKTEGQDIAYPGAGVFPREAGSRSPPNGPTGMGWCDCDPTGILFDKHDLWSLDTRRSFSRRRISTRACFRLPAVEPRRAFSRDSSAESAAIYASKVPGVPAPSGGSLNPWGRH